MQRGFTLIETLIYIALLALIMGGTMAAAYSIIEGTGRTSNSTLVQEEGTFVMSKINWALTGLDTNNPPTPGGSGCSTTLTSTKINFSPNPIFFRLNNGQVEMKEGSGGTYQPITTDNVVVSCLKFSTIAATGNGPAGIKAIVTMKPVNSSAKDLDFSVTKYLRK